MKIRIFLDSNTYAIDGQHFFEFTHVPRVGDKLTYQARDQFEVIEVNWTLCEAEECYPVITVKKLR